MSSVDFLLEEGNQTGSVMEMTNLSQEVEHNEHLAKSLKEMMKKSMREFKASCKAEKKKKADEGTDKMNTEKNLSSIQRPEDVDPSTLGQRRGRKLKNEVVAEKVVTFSLPANFDVTTISASDIDKVKERLGKWRIQRRERDTKSNDMYYCHLSSGQVFRSIPKAVSFILSGTHPRLPKQTSRKRKVDSIIQIDSPTYQLGQMEENPNESFSCQSPSLMQLLNTTSAEEDYRDDRYFCVRDTFMLEEPQNLEASSSQHSIGFLEGPRENDEILFLESEPSMNNDFYNPLFPDSLVENNVQENNNGVNNYLNLEADDRFDLTMNYCQEMIMQDGGNHEGMMITGSVDENAGLFMEMMNDGPHGADIVEATEAVETERVHEGSVNVGEATTDQLVIEEGGNEEEGLLEQLLDRHGEAQHNPQLNELLSISWEKGEDDFFNVEPIDFFNNNNKKK